MKTKLCVILLFVPAIIGGSIYGIYFGIRVTLNVIQKIWRLS